MKQKKISDEELEQISGGVLVWANEEKTLIHSTDNPDVCYTFNNIDKTQLMMLASTAGTFTDEYIIQLALDAGVIAVYDPSKE